MVDFEETLRRLEFLDDLRWSRLMRRRAKPDDGRWRHALWPRATFDAGRVRSLCRRAMHQTTTKRWCCSLDGRVPCHALCRRCSSAVIWPPPALPLMSSTMTITPCLSENMTRPNLPSHGRSREWLWSMFKNKHPLNIFYLSRTTHQTTACIIALSNNTIVHIWSIHLLYTPLSILAHTM